MPANTQFSLSVFRVRHNGLFLDKSQCAVMGFNPFLRRPRRRRGIKDGANRMFSLLPTTSCFARDRRAAVRQSAPVAVSPRAHSATRMRKGIRAATKNPWRRATTGSNHISAFGVWQGRSRRAMTRINRTGETRWHRLPVVDGPADRCVMR
jgi:hypothetical protein